jgi:hypothetical protein
MNTETRQEKLENLKAWLIKQWGDPPEVTKDRLRKNLANMAEPMNQVEYTRENYDRLFPEGKINTPLGEIKMRGDQFKKLERKGRQNLLGAMHQTYTDPITVINENRNGEISKIFGKSFNELGKGTIIEAVTTDRDGKTIGKSTHIRGTNNYLNKIKKSADLLYEKQVGGVGTAEDDTDSLNLAITGVPQSSKNIIPSYPDVNRINKRIFHMRQPMSRV